jgi:hypothetical protein
MKNFFKGIFSSIRWLFNEILNIYSDRPSFFSKKRIESGIAFVISQWGMIFWLITKINVMGTSDFGIWAGMELAAAGYMITQIQKEKKSFNLEMNNVNPTDGEKLQEIV